jgi:LAS superfamily LD-carboxypeptidase LdcB
VSAAFVAAAPLLSPAPGGAQTPRSEPPTQRDEVGRLPGGQPGEDLLRASGESDVVASLDGYEAQVRQEVAAVVAAQASQLAAQGAVDAAHAAVEATEARITELTGQSDAVVIDAFVDPPSLGPLDALEAETPADATVKQVILEQQTDANVDLLSQLEDAQAELAERKAVEEGAVDAAQEAEDDAAVALADLTAAQSSASAFVVAVQDAIARGLAEASALDSIDPAAAEAVRQRQAEVAAKLDEVVAARQVREQAEALRQAMEAAAAQAAAEAASRPASPGRRTPTGASGGLGTVSCPGGGSITMAASVAGELQSMLDAASADGLDMCGGGYRDPADQIAVRRANCGTSSYAIYEMPSSSCSPPTAIPGTSMHEQGLAVDITCGGGTISRSSACFRWLSGNAASYGFYNLPAEPWHWSTDGT